MCRKALWALKLINKIWGWSFIEWKVLCLMMMILNYTAATQTSLCWISILKPSNFSCKQLLIRARTSCNGNDNFISCETHVATQVTKSPLLHDMREIKINTFLYCLQHLAAFKSQNLPRFLSCQISYNPSYTIMTQIVFTLTSMKKRSVLFALAEVVQRCYYASLC